MKRQVIFLLAATMLCLQGCKTKKTVNTEASNKEVISSTTAGDIAGYIEEGVFTFKGIPYAKADRFTPPKEPDTWKEVRECKEFGPIAMQTGRPSIPEKMEEKGSLCLNVWTAGLNDGKKRPVMVWIHGGGFTVGSSSMALFYDGKSLVKKGDVVLVSVNHRLNVLGFLDLSACGEKYAESGNVGMLDLVAALNWVNKNIENFGGDPGNVTIFGQSGGGGKVATLMCMPSAKGLFHKAIIESGALLNIMTTKSSQAMGLALLKVLGLTKDEAGKLDSIPYEKLAAAGDSAMALTVGRRVPGRTTIMKGFSPTPDGKIVLQQPFTPGFSDLSKDIPLMIGTTFNEVMRTFYNEKDMTLEKAKESLVKMYGNKTDAYIKAFAKAYPGYKPQDLLSIDITFRPLTITSADATADKDSAPVYVYMFTWSHPNDSLGRGSAHSLELPFVFNNIELSKRMTGTGEGAFTLADKMSSAWINFAKIGDPNSDNLPKWNPYTSKEGPTMIFDNKCEVRNNYDRELLSFFKIAKML